MKLSEYKLVLAMELLRTIQPFTPKEYCSIKVSSPTPDDLAANGVTVTLWNGEKLKDDDNPNQDHVARMAQRIFIHWLDAYIGSQGEHFRRIDFLLNFGLMPHADLRPFK